MRRHISWLVLMVALLPFSVRAAKDRTDDRQASASNDSERGDEEQATSAPAAAVQSDQQPASLSSTNPDSKKSVRPVTPSTQSVTVGLGGAAVLFGGWAYPRINLRGKADTGFYTHGDGGAFRLFWDFPAWNLDWRLGLDGTLPDSMDLEATVGLRKNLSPWPTVPIVARGGVGLDLMLSGAIKDTVFLVPVVVGKTELAVHLVIVPETFALGAGVELGLRYGIPLGVGFDICGTVRASYGF